VSETVEKVFSQICPIVLWVHSPEAEDVFCAIEKAPRIIFKITVLKKKS
jgi:hypothetical protein